MMYFTRYFHYLRNPYPQNNHYPQFHYTRIKSPRTYTLDNFAKYPVVHSPLPQKSHKENFHPNKFLDISLWTFFHNKRMPRAFPREKFPSQKIPPRKFLDIPPDI